MWLVYHYGRLPLFVYLCRIIKHSEMMKRFKIFTRNWWRENPDWPDGREPDASGRKTTIGYAENEDMARQVCRDWNKTHDEGKLSRRAEFTKI